MMVTTRLPALAGSAAIRRAAHTLAPAEIPFESQIVESGNLFKHKDGTVYAAGQVKKKLDETLRNYMEKNGFNKHPYIYWNSNESEIY